MRTILVLNPKGGSGKSTLSTNLAGFFACWGVRVTLADFDPQASSLAWLTARPASCPVIRGLTIHDNKLPELDDTDYLIIDMPSGAYGNELLSWFEIADRIVIPLLPSPHDFRAAEHFINVLFTDSRLKHRHQSVGIIANRVRENTRSFKLLKSFLQASHISCMGILRDAQNYVLAAQYGLSVFELPAYEVKKDLLQWQHFIKWLCVDPYINTEVPIKPAAEIYELIYCDTYAAATD